MAAGYVSFCSSGPISCPVLQLEAYQLPGVLLLKPHFATDIVANKAKNATKIPDGIRRADKDSPNGSSSRPVPSGVRRSPKDSAGRGHDLPRHDL
jgi:hypothetical protein